MLPKFFQLFCNKNANYLHLPSLNPPRFSWQTQTLLKEITCFFINKAKVVVNSTFKDSPHPTPKFAPSVVNQVIQLTLATSNMDFQWVSGSKIRPASDETQSLAEKHVDHGSNRVEISPDMYNRLMALLNKTKCQHADEWRMIVGTGGGHGHP